MILLGEKNMVVPFLPKIPRVPSKLSFFILFLSCILFIQFALAVFPGYAQQGEAEILLAQATLAYEEGKYDEAIKFLQQAQSLDPNNSRILYYLGLTFLAKKQPATAITHLQTAFELRPSDVFTRYQLGIGHFALHNYDQASPLLFKVYEEQPEIEDLGFYVGFLRYRDKEYDKALEAFEVNRSQDPDIKQLALFYQGLVLGVLGIPEQAIVQLDEALKVEAISPLTQGAIQLRDALAAGRRAPQDKKRFRIQLSVGGFYDDNVAINPNVSSDPIVQQLRSRNTTSPGFLASALFDYSWLRHGPLESTINYQFFQTLNTNDDLSRFNTQDHIVGTGAYYRGTVLENPYQVGLEYSFDYLLLDNVAFLSRHNPTLSVLFVEPSFKLPLLGSVGNLTTGISRYQIKTFYNEPANSDPRFFGPDVRDGYNTMVGISHVFRLFNDAHFVRFGYQYDNENTDGSNFTYRGNKFLTGGQASLPIPTLRLRYSLDIHWRDYNAGPNTFFPSNAPRTVNRKDIQYNHLVQLIDELPYNFSLIFQYQYLRNDSNIGVYDYTKNVFSLIVNWTY